jgi:hypothetical protein
MSISFSLLVNLCFPLSVISVGLSLSLFLSFSLSLCISFSLYFAQLIYLTLKRERYIINKNKHLSTNNWQVIDICGTRTMSFFFTPKSLHLSECGHGERLPAQDHPLHAHQVQREAQQGVGGLPVGAKATKLFSSSLTLHSKTSFYS